MNPNSNDLSQLKRLAIFATVAELGSFAQAAKKLSMNRSSVSEQISNLETYLGMRLLHRTTRKLSLTAEGEMILPEAIQITQSLASVEEKLDDNKVAGTIRLTTTHDFANQWLTPHLLSFQELHPDISFDLVLSDDLLDLIDEQIDLAIRIGFTQSDSSYIARPFLKEKMQLYASPGFLKKYKTPKNLIELQALPWIILKQISFGDQISLISSEDKRQHEFIPKYYHRVDSPIVMIHQVKSGMGIGLSLPSIVQSEVQSGDLISVLPELGTKELIFSLIYPSRKLQPLRIRAFLEYLLAA